MRVIALTGNVAAGKSTVAALLRQYGAAVIDADQIVRQLQRPGEPVYQAIAARFGPAVVTSSGTLDRAALRAIVLADPLARRDLEALVHPAVAAEEVAQLAQARAAGVRVAIVDIPLLFEAGNPLAYDGVLLVDAPVTERRRRLIDERRMKPEEADQLIAAQLPAETKRARATWIIDNTGDLAALAERTAAVWTLLGA